MQSTGQVRGVLREPYLHSCREAKVEGKKKALSMLVRNTKVKNRREQTVHDKQKQGKGRGDCCCSL